MEDDPLQELVGLLDLEPTGADVFRGASCSRSLPFVFGGQVAAQSLAAAYRTTPADRRVHSLHSYFLAPGNPQQPLEFSVSRIRDGRSFTARQVLVQQAGRLVFSASMSFHADEPGLEHADPAPTSPPPNDLLPLSTWLRPHLALLPDWWHGPMAIDLRYPKEPPHVLTAQPESLASQRLWMRSAGSLPDDRGIHECVFTFASDMTLLDPVLLKHGRSWYTGELRAASLDHTIWYHRPFLMDDWVLYDQHSPAGYGGRALSLGAIYNSGGELVASVAQEGLIRLTESLPIKP